MNTNQYYENMFYNTMKYDSPLSFFRKVCKLLSFIIALKVVLYWIITEELVIREIRIAEANTPQAFKDDEFGCHYAIQTSIIKIF